MAVQPVRAAPPLPLASASSSSVSSAPSANPLRAASLGARASVRSVVPAQPLAALRAAAAAAAAAGGKVAPPSPRGLAPAAEAWWQAPRGWVRVLVVVLGIILVTAPVWVTFAVLWARRPAAAPEPAAPAENAQPS